MIDAQSRLVEAGLLPEEMPSNYTFNKVRRILSELNKADATEFDKAIAAASGLELRGALAAAIFIKHHLLGAHEVGVDRIANSDVDGTRYAVLVYPDGEVPVNVGYLPDDVREGASLRYEPTKGRFSVLA